MAESEQKNLRLVGDPFGQLVFLHRSNISDEFREGVMYILDGQEDGNTFNHLYLQSSLQNMRCKYRMVSTPRGIAYCQMKDARERDDVRQDVRFYAESAFLIPFMEQGGVVTKMEQRRLQKKQNLQDMLNEVYQVTDLQTTQQVQKKRSLSSSRVLLYQCEPGTFITQIKSTASHVVLNLEKVWKEAANGRLEFIPHKQEASQTSLLLDCRIRLEPYQDFWGQSILFNRRDLLESTFRYTVWNQTLEEVAPDSFYSEKFTFKAEDDYPIECTMYCEKRFMGSPMMVVFFVTSFSEDIQGEVFRAMLKKGIMVILFGGRGTLAGSYENFEAGIGQKRLRNAQDLLSAAKHLIKEGVAMVQTQVIKDVTAYGKGHIGAFTVLMANILEPQLFTASCVVNGHYDADISLAADDSRLLSKIVGRYDQTKPNASLSPLTIPFHKKDLQPGQLSIVDLSNFIVMSDPQNRVQSRKLIARIRSDRRPYRELYYFQGATAQECDFHAACYLFKHMLFNSTSQ